MFTGSPHPARMIETTAPALAAPDRTDALRKAARALESAFLAEMLKYAGTDRPPDTFGGGIGEAQFSSFLTRAEADAIVRHGGIGLAEHLFESLKARGDGTG
jgi:Rod binding domain-containing protein